MMIILMNRLNDIFTEVGDAKLLAVHVHLHVESIGRGLDSITGKKLAKVLTVHFWSTLGSAEGEAVKSTGRRVVVEVNLFTLSSTLLYENRRTRRAAQ